MESSSCKGFSVKTQQCPSKDKNTEVTFLAQLQIKPATMKLEAI